MDKDMKVYIKNNAKVTEDFIRTMESQEAAQEELDKVRKQTRRYRAASGLGVFLLIVILLYSIVTVIVSDKSKTYFVDIERTMPEITLDDLEEFDMDVDYYCATDGSDSGITNYSVNVYAGGGSIAQLNAKSTDMTDSYKVFQDWLTDKGVSLDDTTSTKEKLYESSELLAQMCQQKLDYKVKKISKNEKRFKCSPAIHYKCSEPTKGYEYLISTYFNKDFVTLFSKVHEFEKVETENDYFYVSFYNEDIDIDEVCDIVTNFLKDNAYCFSQVVYDETSVEPLSLWQTGYVCPEGSQFNTNNYDLNYTLNNMVGATITGNITHKLKVLLQELDPDVEIEHVSSEEDEAPITIKFCISGEYYEFYAYLMHLYGLI